ncbi:MAG: ABC transporter permease [Deltaproteobacteria bacterium]|nr:ABC transporter permease [Deltaproteobacteria bacterium]
MKALRKCWAFVVKDFLTDISYRTAFAGQVVSLVFMVAAFYFFARMFEGTTIQSLEPYGGDYFPFVLVGLAFSSYLGVAVRSFADTIRNAQVLGTLEALLVTPTPVGQIIVFSTIYAFLVTSLRVVLTLLLGMLLFGVRFPDANWLGALLVLVLTIISFSFLGVLSAGVVLAIKRGDPSSWLVQGLSYLLGGVYYPVSILPDWGQTLAQLLPITHALEAMRLLLLKGASLGDVQYSLFALLLFSAVAGPISVFVFWLALGRVKRDGSLSQF